MIVWLGSLGHLRRAAIRVDTGHAAGSPSVKRLLGEAGFQNDDSVLSLSDRAFALVELEIEGVYHLLQKLSDEQQIQLSFWETVADLDLHGRAFWFRVKRIVRLAHDVPLRRWCDKKFRGFVNRLEPEQCLSLICALESHPCWLPADGAGGACSVMLRVPGPYAKLVALGQWTSLLLPHLPAGGGHGGNAGTSAIQISWDMLSVKPSELPAVPAVFDDFDVHGPGGVDAAEINAELVRRSVDWMRTLASGEQLVGEDDMTDLLTCIIDMQSFQKQLTPLHFMQNAKELKGRHHWTDSTKVLASRVPYKVSFLLRAMLMGDLLRHSGTLRQVLSMAIGMVLPSTLRKCFQGLLESCAQVIPAASTISKWRLVLDAAIMVHERQANDSERNGRKLRHFMADSSSQHNRSFEYIVVTATDEAALPELLQSVRDIVALWLWSH